MKPMNPANEDCRPVGEILNQIGSKWTMRIINALSDGPLRFSAIQREVGGISQKVLTATLRELEMDGFVTRTVTPSIPPRVDYELTELGHDLQEPLRKIQAFGDILESEYATKIGDGMEYLTRMRAAASRMSVLIEDLLSFSRVTTKTQPSVEVNLNTLVADVISDLDDRINRTQGEVKVGQLPTVWADPTHMRQLLQNLIGNALKFHRENVPPVVTVESKEVQKGDEMYEITVTDNGIGFEEKYLDRIFSVFQRLHGRGTYEGTGIGLAVCRKIAERYGGTITASSTKNSGSTFIFKIPIKAKGVEDDNDTE